MLVSYIVSYAITDWECIPIFIFPVVFDSLNQGIIYSGCYATVECMLKVINKKQKINMLNLYRVSQRDIQVFVVNHAHIQHVHNILLVAHNC